MRKVNLFIVLLAALFVFTGCTQGQKTNENPAGGEGNKDLSGKEDESSVEPIESMREYFPPDGSKLFFKGEGNEFAEYHIEVAQPHKNYFVIFEDNGGTIIRKIFRIEKDRIDIIDSNIIGIVEKNFPSLKEMDSMKSSSIYLQKPFTLGSVFENWTVVETDLTIETPYQTYDNVFVIEEKVENAVNRKYFATGIGEIKREAVMETGDGKTVTVTSTLESLGE